MSIANFQQGQWIRHPKCPDWGVGEIVGVEPDAVLVVFENVGERKINTRFVALEITDAPKNRNPKLVTVVGANLERLCTEFHELMKDNRPNSDDGGMGLNVLKDLRERGHLTKRVQKQLLAWCHTEGTVYQVGVDLARQICRQIYGRVPTRDEIKLSGL
jgi:hypothetical protein